jgi:hypothetical protein
MEHLTRLIGMALLLALLLALGPLSRVSFVHRHRRCEQYMPSQEGVMHDLMARTYTWCH